MNDCYNDDIFDIGSLFFGVWGGIARSQIIDINDNDVSLFFMVSNLIVLIATLVADFIYCLK